MADALQVDSSNQYEFTDILKQVNFATPQQLSEPETGKKIAQKIWLDQNVNNGGFGFFKGRSVRWLELLSWATGTQNMAQFLDFFNVSDGNKSYVKLDLTPIMVGAQFVGTLVESMAKNEEYPCVTAIDDGSRAEKEDRKADAIYRMYDREDIGAMQEGLGMPLEPIDAYVPDDPLSAEVYFKLEDRLPKEIDFEEYLEKTLVNNQYRNVLKERFIYDLVVYNAAFSKVEKTKTGLCIRKCIGQNMIYNFIIGDTGKNELKYIGEVYAMKISDIRGKYKISEKEMFELARMSTQNNVGMNYTFAWQEDFNFYNYNRPWDDYSVYMFDFEIQLEDTDYYVSKTDGFGNDNITPKKGKPQPKSEKAKVLAKKKKRWYHGVYAVHCDKIIYWGKPDLVIFPYNDTENGLSSYSVNIPKNNGGYVPSLFERAMEPLKEYALVKLKRKQLIAKLRPSGIRIDVENARNLDLGNGNTMPWEEVVRIFDQTGNELWSSRGLDPNEETRPALSSTLQDDTLQKIMQLSETIASLEREIRVLLGVPNYRDGADVGDRTAAKLADQQNVSSFNVTDFVQTGHNQLMQETLYKCALIEWQNRIKAGDVDLINARFDITVEMKLSAYERQLLENNINIWSKTVDGNGKPLLSPKDVFKIRQIKNYKLAEMYLANVIETNEKRASDEAARREQSNAQLQEQAGIRVAQETLKIKQEEIAAEQQLTEFKSVRDQQLELLKIAGQISSKGLPLPDYLISMMQLVIPNISLPLQQENDAMLKAIQSQRQQEMEASMQEQSGVPPDQVQQPQLA